MSASLELDDVEVDGRNVKNITDAFRLFPEVGLRALVRRGIGRTTDDGRYVVDASGWYPMRAWLQALGEILDVVGPAKMTEVGRHIPENAHFPPSIDSLASALAQLDAAYHLNHRIRSRVMFDLTSGVILEGIGHYHCREQRAHRATMECDNPYPCDFDRGILFGLGKRFGQSVRITHPEDLGCRKRGGPSCTYVIDW